MIIIKVAVLLAAACACAAADKKIELQDIEEDNLKSEKEQTSDAEEYPQPAAAVDSSAGSGRAVVETNPLDYIKNELLKLYENQYQPRYVHQYAVTEPPSVTEPSSQSVIGYMPNMPMQILYIPQYYDPHNSPSSKNIASYAETTAADQNYIEVPAAYIAPSAKGYSLNQAQYAPNIAYVTYGPAQVTGPANVTPQPTAAPQLAAPVHNIATAPAVYTSTMAAPVAYAMPVVYSQSIMPPLYHRPYYPYYETNAVEETTEESTKETTERPQKSMPSGESIRFYTRPSKGDRGQPSAISQLPHPTSVFYESHTPNLGIPKVLPYYRPSTKPVYSHISGNLIPGTIPHKGRDLFTPMYKKRPLSLLDSYVPSSVQLEYMKHGHSRDPLSTYEVLSSGRFLPQPRHVERGFLPNQMFHTAAGGITFGHYKRTTPERKPH